MFRIFGKILHLQFLTKILVKCNILQHFCENLQHSVKFSGDTIGNSISIRTAQSFFEVDHKTADRTRERDSVSIRYAAESGQTSEGVISGQSNGNSANSTNTVNSMNTTNVLALEIPIKSPKTRTRAYSANDGSPETLNLTKSGGGASAGSSSSSSSTTTTPRSGWKMKEQTNRMKKARSSRNLKLAKFQVRSNSEIRDMVMRAHAEKHDKLTMKSRRNVFKHQSQMTDSTLQLPPSLVIVILLKFLGILGKC